MKDNTDRHRRSVRLQGYNYAHPGAYFVTICTQGRKCLFGEITNGEMRLNPFGNVVLEEWIRTAKVRKNIELDSFVVMPNHFHGIIELFDTAVGATRRVALSGTTHRVAPTMAMGPASGSIGAIIGQFKSVVTKRINEMRGILSSPLWQRNYYEHVIRNENELNKIREYILSNPLQWVQDRENPAMAVREPPLQMK